MLKRCFVSIIIFATILSLVLGCANQSNESPAVTDSSDSTEAPTSHTPAESEVSKLEVIKIGIACPLTGGSAELGNRTLKGAQMAIDAVNKAGGINGVQVELVAQDDQSDPKQSANIANMFSADKDIIACISGFNSSCVLAGAPIYNEEGLVNIAVGASSPKISECGPYTFRVWPSDTYRASVIMNVPVSEGYTKFGILYQNDDFGVGALNVAKSLLAENGLEPVIAEGFLLGETKDFNTIITKMKNAECDALFLIADESELAAFMVQMHAQGWKPFVCSTGTYNPAVLNLGGEAVEGLAGGCMWDPAFPPEKVAEYWKHYETVYGVAISDTSSPCAYDTIGMILQVLKNGATTRDDMRDGLHALKDYPGVVTNFNFDENGDVFIPYTVIKIEGGKFVPYNS